MNNKFGEGQKPQSRIINECDDLISISLPTDKLEYSKPGLVTLGSLKGLIMGISATGTESAMSKGITDP